MFLGPVGDDPQSTEVRRLGIRPGDVLVVQLDHFADEYEAEHIRQSVAGAFKGSGCMPPVLIVETGAEVGVIGPDEAQPSGIVRQAALEALLSTGFDPFNARAVLGMGQDEAA